MVNVVLDLKCMNLKFVLETINHNNVDPVIWWAQISIMVATIKFTFSFIKKLNIPRSLVGSTYFFVIFVTNFHLRNLGEKSDISILEQAKKKLQCKPYCS